MMNFISSPWSTILMAPSAPISKPKVLVCSFRVFGCWSSLGFVHPYRWGIQGHQGRKLHPPRFENWEHLTVLYFWPCYHRLWLLRTSQHTRYKTQLQRRLSWIYGTWSLPWEFLQWEERYLGNGSHLARNADRIHPLYWP